MADSYNAGETKTRPGVHYRYENGGGLNLSGALNGITAVAFRANWGPLGKVISISDPSEIADLFGDDANAGSYVSILTDIFQGGASEIKAVRVGTGGTKAAITLKDTTTGTAVDVVTLTAKYAGTRALSVTIKDSLSVDTQRECIIYSGTRELCTIPFAKGSAGEVDALVAAVNASKASVVTATKVAAGNGLLAAITQSAFTTAGVSPTIANTDYDAAFSLLEASEWNTICVDTNETAVHMLLKTFINRANDAGLLGIAVVGEPTSVEYETRKTRAASYNSANFVYCLNGVSIGGVAYEGYKIAAVIAGLIAYAPSNRSLTHWIVTGATEIIDALSNTKIVECLKSGCLVFTKAKSGAVQIEQGITTLVNLGANQDAGWKKIRRTKTRFELMSRINENTEGVIGQVDNDDNGRATVISIGNGVIKDMISEKKLKSGTMIVDKANPPQGDSSWFTLDIVDLDSIEHVYLNYRFRFSED